ncbi:uncharacterized protein LOC125502260 [Athalia rosae]|uniref:uncharacterized protein LOC125502260 n=1 Tax=Athalia rosae TaxID=37344 RepID=UPI002033EA58|nr:uncharacterized protein LOC125502260 [Athalia rosae]
MVIEQSKEVVVARRKLSLCRKLLVSYCVVSGRAASNWPTSMSYLPIRNHVHDTRYARTPHLYRHNAEALRLPTSPKASRRYRQTEEKYDLQCRMTPRLYRI